MPDFPSCASGLLRDCATLVSKEMEPAPWFEVEFEIGRRRFDSQFSTAWHSSFETFASLQKAFGPVYRLPLRARASRVGVLAADRGNPVAAGAAFETTLRVTPSPVLADEVERMLLAYVDEIPVSVIRALCALPDLLNLSGQSALEPLGVVPGLVFAAVTRASYAARLRWFESLDWN